MSAISLWATGSDSIPRVSTDQHVGLAIRRVNDRSVVIDLRYVAGLMCDPHVRRQPGWDRFIEFLIEHDSDHLVGCRLRYGAAFGDQAHNDHKVARGGNVIQAPVVSLAVLDSAQHLDVIRSDAPHQGHHFFGGHLFDQDVGRQITA